MAISERARAALSSSSMIRKMFEEGIALKKKHGAERVFDFSLGNPDLEPPPEFFTALSEIAAARLPGVHGYMPNAGFPDVREAIAKKASREQGVAVAASHIVMSAGAAGALNVVFKTLLNPGGEVVVPVPFFPEYGAYIANHGGVFVPANTARNFALDFAAIEAALSPRTEALLINSPHNPTGRVYTREELAALAALLESYGARFGKRPWLIVDEPYRELVYDGASTPPVLGLYDNTIIVNSYSKSLSLPGERIGYITAGPRAEDAGLLVDALSYATRTLGFVNAPALMQRVAARLGEVSVDVGVYEHRRNALLETLVAAGLRPPAPQGAFYLFAKVPRRGGGNGDEEGAGGDDLAFVEELKRQLILAVPGSGFGVPGWVRFAYCVDEKIIRASAEAFRRALECWRDG